MHSTGERTWRVPSRANTIFSPSFRGERGNCRRFAAGRGLLTSAATELATALRDEGRRLDGPLCRLEERLATLQTGRNYLPRNCIWLPHATFHVSLYQRFISAAVSAPESSLALVSSLRQLRWEPAISRVRIDHECGVSPSEVSCDFLLRSVSLVLSADCGSEGCDSPSRSSRKGVARAESSARKVVRGRDALVANRRLRHRSRISKVSGARLPRRRRRRHCCSETRRKTETTNICGLFRK